MEQETKVDLSQTPDFAIIEDQIAELCVDSLSEGNWNGKLTVDIETHIVDGAAGWTGFNLRSRFFLGTDEDPKGEQPQTRRGRNWTKLKNFLRACDVATAGNMSISEYAELVQGQTFLGNIGHYSKGEGENVKFYNTINSYHRVGSREVGLTEKREKANGLDTSPTAMRAQAERMVPRSGLDRYAQPRTANDD